MPMRQIFPFIVVFLSFVPRTGSCQKEDSVVVFFGFNRWDISPDADSALRAFAREHPSIERASLSGFCDAIGGDKYNDALSMRRAVAVARYLDRVAGARIIAKVRGFGKRRPLNGNGTEEERSMNRRVVVSVAPASVGASVAPTTGLPVSSAVSLASPFGGPISAALKDSATRVGTSIVLKNVNFYGGRHFPLDSSYAALDDLLRAMRDNSRLVIRIEGYVCCLPDSLDGPDIDTHKPNLSVARARFVYDYLIDHGIDGSRMSYVGFGSANKIYPTERDPFEQEQNRRVEVRVIAK